MPPPPILHAPPRVSELTPSPPHTPTQGVGACPLPPPTHTHRVSELTPSPPHTLTQGVGAYPLPPHHTHTGCRSLPTPPHTRPHRVSELEKSLLDTQAGLAAVCKEKDAQLAAAQEAANKAAERARTLENLVKARKQAGRGAGRWGGVRYLVELKASVLELRVLRCRAQAVAAHREAHMSLSEPRSLSSLFLFLFLALHEGLDVGYPSRFPEQQRIG